MSPGFSRQERVGDQRRVEEWESGGKEAGGELQSIQSPRFFCRKGKKKKRVQSQKKIKNRPDGFQVWLKREPIFEIFWKLEAPQLKDQKVLAL